MKIVFLSGGRSNVARGAYAQAHNLRKHGHKVIVFDYFDRLSDIQIFQVLTKYLERGDLVGLSSTFFENNPERYGFVYDIAHRRGCEVVIGGLNPRREDFKYDYDFLGNYNEDDFLKFVNQKTGKIRFTPYTIRNDDFMWHADDFIPQKACVPVEISRHCVFNCKFCSFPNRGTKGENRQMALVRRELDYANTLYSTSHFMLLCSTFNDSKDKLREFFDAVSDTNYVFSAYIRLDLLVKQKEFWPMFKKHIKHMCFGVETLQWDSGKSIGKGTNPEVVLEWLQEVREYFDDCITYTNFITGLPFSTVENEWKTLELMNTGKYVDGFNFVALYVDGEDRPYTPSYFDRNIGDYGYTITTEINVESEYRNKVEWVREDGMSYKSSYDLSVELNNLRISTPQIFTTVVMGEFHTINEMKQMRSIGTVGKDVINPTELNEIRFKMFYEYYRNVGAFDPNTLV